MATARSMTRKAATAAGECSSLETDASSKPQMRCLLRSDYLPFRLENSFVQYRPTEPADTAPGARSDPETGEHNGTRLGHVVRPPQQANAMRYQVAGGHIFSGLTRVAWELEEVVAGMGGTSVLSGSHKAHFNYGGPDPWTPNISRSPWEGAMQDSMESYSCPAGSALIFTESLM